MINPRELHIGDRIKYNGDTEGKVVESDGKRIGIQWNNWANDDIWRESVEDSIWDSMTLLERAPMEAVANTDRHNLGTWGMNL